MDIFQGLFGSFVAVCLLLLFLNLVFNNKRNGVKGKESAIAGAFWLFLFFAGFWVQFVYRQWMVPQDFPNALSNVAESIDKSIAMFGFGFKTPEIVIDSWAMGGLGKFYAVISVLIFLSAGIWTQCILVTLFFKGIRNAIAIWWHQFGGRRGTHYVVIGCGEDVEDFIKSLEKSRKLGFFRDSVTIITGKPTDGKSTEDYYKSYLRKNYAVIAGKADESALCRVGLKKTRRKTVFCVLTKDDEQNLAVASLITQELERRWNAIEGNEKIRAEIQAKKAELIEKALKKESEEKVKEKEEDFEKTARDGVKGKYIWGCNLEAHVAYTFIERSDHFTYFDNVCGKVSFINKYEMRARKFFFDHPIAENVQDFIDASKGRLKGKYDAETNILVNEKTGKPYVFKHIFVGFGNGNYHMLKASVIYGQILGANFNATIFSNDIDEKYPKGNQAKFIHQAPGLFDGFTDLRRNPELHYLPLPSERYRIKFKESNILSNAFYDALLKEIDVADRAFVYISLGNDKLDVETAMEIRQLLLTHKEALLKTKVYAKVKHPSSLSEAQIIQGNEIFPKVLECYGFDNETMSLEEVTSYSADITADLISNQNHDTPWYMTPEFEKDSNRTRIAYLRSAIRFIGYDLKERARTEAEMTEEEKAWLKESVVREQSTAADAKKEKKKASGQLPEAERNKPASQTKPRTPVEKEYENAYGLAYLKALPSNDPLRKIKYFETDEDGKVKDTPRNNLAKLEHLRWDALYIANGFVQKPFERIGTAQKDDAAAYLKDSTDPAKFSRKNLSLREHACITSVEGLIELRKYQAFLAEKGNENVQLSDAYEKFRADARYCDRTALFFGEEKWDTTNYDFSVPDALVDRLEKLRAYNRKEKFHKIKEYVLVKVEEAPSNGEEPKENADQEKAAR